MLVHVLWFPLFTCNRLRCGKEQCYKGATSVKSSCFYVQLWASRLNTWGKKHLDLKSLKDLGSLH